MPSTVTLKTLHVPQVSPSQSDIAVATTLATKDEDDVRAEYATVRLVDGTALKAGLESYFEQKNVGIGARPLAEMCIPCSSRTVLKGRTTELTSLL